MISRFPSGVLGPVFTEYTFNTREREADGKMRRMNGSAVQVVSLAFSFWFCFFGCGSVFHAHDFHVQISSLPLARLSTSRGASTSPSSIYFYSFFLDFGEMWGAVDNIYPGRMSLS